MRLRPLIPALALLFAAAGCLPPQGAGLPAPAVLDARDTATLANGMQVLIRRTASPLVASLILVRAGSSRETAANAGVSHILEHVLFDGTERRTKAELFREVYGMGGYLNGFTTEDYTGYILMAHPDFLDRMLDIQADILFHSRFDPAKLEVTKGVVLEELRQAHTRPAARQAAAHKARLYRGTGYAHPVLGGEQTIRGLAPEEIQAYHRAHYVPNNMVAVLIGPVDRATAVAKLARAFGGEAPRPVPSGRDAIPAPPARAEVFLEETSAPQPALALGLIVPAAERERYPAWEVLAGVLDGRLKAARERPGAPQVHGLGAGFSLGRDFGLLEVTAKFPRETSEAAVRRLVDGELARLAAGPLAAEEVARVRKSLVADELLLRERIHYFAMAEAPRLLALGPAGALTYGERIARITGEEVAAAAQALAAPRYVASVFLPAEPSPAESARAGRPPERRVLPNGLTLIAEEVPGSPVFAAHVLIRGRGVFEAPGQEGLVEAVLRLLSRGTARRTAAELARTLQEMGGRLETAGDPSVPFGDFYTSREFGAIRLEAPGEHAAEALALLREILTQPRLDPEDVARVRGELRAFVEATEAQPRRAAEALLLQTLLPGSPLARPIYGTAASVASLRREDLLALADRYLAGANLIVSVVSGLPAERALREAAAALGGLPAGRPAPAPLPLPRTRGIREARERLGQPQAQLLLGRILFPESERERFALEIAGSILSAKLFGTLREREGLAYSVDAGVSFPRGGALLLAGLGTAPESLERARAGILRELTAAAESTPSREDIERRANGIAGRLIMRQLASITRAHYLGLAEFQGLSTGYGEAYRQALLAVTPTEAAAALRAAFAPEAYVLAIVE